MTNLHIDRQGVRLKHEHGSLRLDSDEGKVQRVPLHQLQRVVLHSEGWVSVGLLRQLAAAHVPLVVTAGRTRGSAAMLWPHAGDGRRRLRQYQALLDDSVRLQLAKACVRLRLTGQRRVLLQARQLRADLRLPLVRVLQRLQSVSDSIDAATSVEQLRGVEGAAARSYFEAFRSLFPDSLGFCGRQRRPPPDPVNAALSLGYSLLFARALEQIHCCGLDATLGALHEPEHNRPSAACDLQESERHVIERYVWRAFAEKRLRAEHFSHGDDGCLLRKEGRSVYFGGIEPVLRQAALRMRRRIYRLVAEQGNKQCRN